MNEDPHSPNSDYCLASSFKSSPITKKDAKPEALILQAIQLIERYMSDSIYEENVFWSQYVYPTVRAYRAVDSPSDLLQESMRETLMRCSEYISRQTSTSNRLLDLDRYRLSFFPCEQSFKALEMKLDNCGISDRQPYYRVLYQYAKKNQMTFEALYYYSVIVCDGDRIKSKFCHFEEILSSKCGFESEKALRIKSIIDDSHEAMIRDLKDQIAKSPQKVQKSPPIAVFGKPLVALDTNVLLADTFGYLGEFLDFIDIVIPLPVIEELYDLKSNKIKAPRALRALEFLASNTNIINTVNRFGETCNLSLKEPVFSFRVFGKMDDQIIECCVHLSRKTPERKCVFLTEDLNASLKAKAEGMMAMSFKEFTEQFYIQ